MGLGDGGGGDRGEPGGGGTEGWGGGAGGEGEGVEEGVGQEVGEQRDWEQGFERCETTVHEMMSSALATDNQLQVVVVGDQRGDPVDGGATAGGDLRMDDLEGDGVDRGGGKEVGDGQEWRRAKGGQQGAGG